MARDLFNLERGIKISDENSDSSISILTGSAAPNGTDTDQAAAEIGSLYIRRGTGEFYQKITDTNSIADWELNGSGSGIVSRWRNEIVDLSTGDTLSAGSFDVTTLTDLESTLSVADTVVGHYITDGSGNLWEITANGSFPTITIAAASSAPVEGDAFITNKYLVDSPADQENQAGILFTSGGFTKIFDVDFGRAEAVFLSASYAAQNGNVAPSESVESAIEKLDGNQQDLTTLSGVSQGSTDLGAFTGSTIPDAQTTKQALQSLETAHEEVDQNVNDLITLSGRPENSTSHGPMDQGDILSDSSTSNALFKEVDAELTRQRGKSSGSGITTNTTIDQVLVDEVSACKWLITIENTASPANKIHVEAFVGHNGHASADASGLDDTVYAKLKLGSNFNYDLNFVLAGSGASQFMRMEISSTEPSGVNIYAKRIEVLF
jgi:hypothetical protein